MSEASAEGTQHSVRIEEWLGFSIKFTSIIIVVVFRCGWRRSLPSPTGSTPTLDKIPHLLTSCPYRLDGLFVVFSIS